MRPLDASYNENRVFESILITAAREIIVKKQGRATLPALVPRNFGRCCFILAAPLSLPLQPP